MHFLASIVSLICLVNVSGLNIGDRAPALEDTLWIKGSAPAFEKQFTVVEVWATWCSVCRSEASHLTRLQQFYGERVQIVGISDEPSSDIARYVGGMGDEIGYSIGKVSKELRGLYMKGVDGIPQAFLINPEGFMIWSGHPMDLDEILDKALAGTLDIERLKRVADLEKNLKETLKTGNLDVIGQVADALLMEDPVHERALDVRGVVAKRQKDTAAFRAMYDRIDVAGLRGEKANRLAWKLVTDKNLPFRYLKAALELAAHSVKMEPENGAFAVTYARVQYCMGNIREAIKWQKKAIEFDPFEPAFDATLQYYLEIEDLRRSEKASHL